MTTPIFRITTPKFRNRTILSNNAQTGLSIISSVYTLRTVITWISIPVYLLGLTTNILNIVIYTLIGLRDNVTICFFALSVCDLCYTVIGHNNNIVNVLDMVMPSVLVDFDFTNSVFVFYGSMLLDISVLIKTFIAVQRGCCVAIPFHVNRLFTNKKTSAVIVSLCILCFVPYVNFEFFRFILYYKNPFNNKTYVYQIYNQDTVLSEKIRFIFNKIIVVFTSEILVFLSLVVIIYGMTSSSKWRKSLPAGETSTQNQANITRRSIKWNLPKKEVHSNKINDNQQSLETVSKPITIKDTREMRVVKQVTLVSVIHLICYTPVVVDSLIYYLVQVRSLPYVVWYVHEGLERFNAFTGSLSAAINFFIYYRYNSKFTQRVSRLCRTAQANRD